MKRDTYVKKLRIEEAYLRRDKLPSLLELTLEITERCNNNCIHCGINLPSDDLDAMSKELDTKDIQAIITEAASLGCQRIKITGGEPLLREDFEELYLFARRLGLRVLIYTNATMITPYLADLFSRIPPLERIEVTLYGMKRKTYESISRNTGAFEAAWQGVNLLLQRRIPFIVKSVFLPANTHEIKEFDLWSSTIPWMNNIPPSYSVFFDLRNRRDSEEKNRIIKSLRPSPVQALNFLTRRRERYIEISKRFFSKFANQPGEILFNCGSGRRIACLDAYGNLQPCLLLRHPDAIYKLKDGSLSDALKSFFPKLREKKATNPDYLRRCARCFLKQLCEQCPAKSWIEYGTLDTPIEYLCEFSHAQARYFGMLKEGEMAWEVNDWKDRVSNFTNKVLDAPRTDVG